MSSDNYYAIRQDSTDGLWYLYHGFMSTLEDGFPATSKRSEGYATEVEVLSFYRAQSQGFMESYYSEYGLIDEGSEDELRAARLEFFRRWPEDLAEDWAAPYRAELEGPSGEPAEHAVQLSPR